MLFSGTRFLVVSPDSAVLAAISAHGGSVVGPDTDLRKVSHIVAPNYNFPAYRHALELLLPITSAEWVHDSVKKNHKQNYRLYSPQPLPFMDKVVLCAADNLPVGDKELMYGATRAFGGQYLDCLSRYTTHLVATDLSNNKAVVASNISPKENLHIHIVLPDWVDACVRQQRHVPEEKYLLGKEVLQTGAPRPGADEPTTSLPQLLSGKRVYFHGDFDASEKTQHAVETLAERCGATIVHSASPGDIDVYVGKYRQGSLFWECFGAGVDVVSMSWLYHVVMRAELVAPLSSNMLHFPLPAKPVPQFVGLRISITGVSGDARHYLVQLLVAMGAEFTRTLDANNDLLVCGAAAGEKYAAATSRWKNVSVVSYLWVEECFQSWQYLDPKLPRYAELDSPERALGETRLKKDLIQPEMAATHIESSQNSVMSSQGESQGGKYPEGESQGAKHPEGESQGAKHPEGESQGAKHPEGESQGGKYPEGESPRKNPDGHENGASQSSIVSLDSEGHDGKDNEPPRKRKLSDAEDHTNSSNETPVSRGRSAKQKASMKLHTDMQDLNQYTSMAKSVRKMNDYMKQLEKAEDTQDPKAKEDERKKPVYLRVIMTGCEQTLVLSRADVAKLARAGIMVVSDYSPKKPIDTLVAPKILRTEKFLKSLSKASKIVHPEFLAKILSRIGPDTSYPDLTSEFNIDDYSLDKIVPVKKINQDLGYVGKGSGLQHVLGAGRGQVFGGLKVNLSSNLNGGPDLIGSILREHGLSEWKVVKSDTNLDNLLAMENETVFVAHKTKDKSLISQMRHVTVVDWDWCVKSIFNGERQPYRAS